MENKKNIGIGIVGSGNMAGRHLRAFKKVKGARVLAVSSRNESTLRSLCFEFRVKDGYVGLDGLLVRDDIDAVIVATPTYTHEEIVKQCLNYGKHVLCEKPLALDIAQADSILDAQRKANKILMVGFPLRFSPEFVYAKQLISQGRLGNIKVAWFRYGKSLPQQSWYHEKEKSGGVIAELAVHFIDCLRWLIGSEVESVVSEASGDIYKLGKEDNVWAIYRFLNGAIGVVGSSYSFNSFEPDAGIIGDESALKFIRGRVIIDDYRRKKTPLAVAMRDYLSGLIIPFALLKDTALTAELQHFVDCVKNNVQPQSCGEDAKKTLAVVQATQESANTGQRARL